MSVFLILAASSTVRPLTHSVARLDEEIALPQPNVLNLASSITPVSTLTLICSFMTSPHSGAPTSPVPTPGVSLVKGEGVAAKQADKERTRQEAHERKQADERAKADTK